MSTIDAGPSSNGRPPPSWSESWTHCRVERPGPAHCRVTFDHPPANAITSTTVAELAELVGLIEHDADLDVVVFASATPGFYLTDDDPHPARTRAWVDLLAGLSRAPAVSIAAVRGRTGAAGTEFVLACDLRLASREATVPGQFGARSSAIRLIADDRLDDEVDRIASRLAGVDREL